MQFVVTAEAVFDLKAVQERAIEIIILSKSLN